MLTQFFFKRAITNSCKGSHLPTMSWSKATVSLGNVIIRCVFEIPFPDLMNTCTLSAACKSIALF